MSVNKVCAVQQGYSLRILYALSIRTRFRSEKNVADAKLEGEPRIALTSLSTDVFLGSFIGHSVQDTHGRLSVNSTSCFGKKIAAVSREKERLNL